MLFRSEREKVREREKREESVKRCCSIRLIKAEQGSVPETNEKVPWLVSACFLCMGLQTWSAGPGAGQGPSFRALAAPHLWVESGQLSGRRRRSTHIHKHTVSHTHRHPSTHTPSHTLTDTHSHTLIDTHSHFHAHRISQNALGKRSLSERI